MLSQGQKDPKCNDDVTRIRGYRNSSTLVCPYRTVTKLTMVIDNVTALDSGNYTCYLEDEWDPSIRLDKNVILNTGRVAN